MLSVLKTPPRPSQGESPSPALPRRDGVVLWTDGTFYKERGEGVGCLLEFVDVGDAGDCIILFRKFLNSLRIANNNATGIEVVVKCFALTEELWREQQVEMLALQ